VPVESVFISFLLCQMKTIFKQDHGMLWIRKYTAMTIFTSCFYLDMKYFEVTWCRRNILHKLLVFATINPPPPKKKYMLQYHDHFYIMLLPCHKWYFKILPCVAKKFNLKCRERQCHVFSFHILISVKQGRMAVI
jgi:hypothetical protein